MLVINIHWEKFGSCLLYDDFLQVFFPTFKEFVNNNMNLGNKKVIPVFNEAFLTAKKTFVL